MGGKKESNTSIGLCMLVNPLDMQGVIDYIFDDLALLGQVSSVSSCFHYIAKGNVAGDGFMGHLVAVLVIYLLYVQGIHYKY